MVTFSFLKRNGTLKRTFIQVGVTSPDDSYSRRGSQIPEVTCWACSENKGPEGKLRGPMASSHQSLIGTCARENSCVFDGDGQHLPQHSGSFFVSVADKAFSFVTQHFSILKLTFNRVLLDLDLCYLHGDDFVNLYRNLVFSKQNLKGRFWLHPSPAIWNISLSVASLLRVPESC